MYAGADQVSNDKTSAQTGPSAHAAVNTCCDMIFYLSKVSFTDFGPGELNESMPCGFVYLYL